MILLLLPLPLLLLLLLMFVRRLLDELLLPVVLVMLQQPMLHFSISCLTLAWEMRDPLGQKAQALARYEHDKIGPYIHMGSMPRASARPLCAAETGNMWLVGVGRKTKKVDFGTGFVLRENTKFFCCCNLHGCLSGLQRL